MPRKTTPDPSAQADSEWLHSAIQDLIDSLGRGGLTMVSERIGMKPPALLKRLKVPGKAFDAPTLRAVALLTEIHREAAAETPATPEQDADTPVLPS